MKKYKFYKEGNRWYVDLPEWDGEKADLEMVAGADTMLEYMAEDNDEVDLYISETKFEGADCLKLIGLATDIGSGAYYDFNKYRGIEIGLSMWLCDVMLFVFGKFPKKLYVAATNLS